MTSALGGNGRLTLVACADVLMRWLGPFFRFGDPIRLCLLMSTFFGTFSPEAYNIHSYLIWIKLNGCSCRWGCYISKLLE